MTGGSFGYLVKQGLHNIRQNKMMSVASVFVLLSCMLLVGAAILFSFNINAVLSTMADENQILVFLQTDINAIDLQNTEADIRSLDAVETVKVLSKDEARDFMKERLSAGYETVFDAYEGESNPFPDTIVITLNKLDMSEAVVRTIDGYASVHHITAPQNITTVLIAVRNGVSAGSFILVSLLVIVSLVLTGNTIKLTVFNRRKEINIMKFVGATDGFIRFPFVVEGVVIGLLAALLAFGATAAYYTYLSDAIMALSIPALAFLTTSIISFKAVALPLLGGFLAAGILTGGVGSFVFVRKHLKV